MSQAMKSSRAAGADQAAGSATLHRPCSCRSSGGSCARCGAGRRSVQRKSDGSAIDEAAASRVDRTLSSPGAAMPPATRAAMESRFNHDFSGVRVHSDAQATESARDVGAVAYASGPHVVLGRAAVAAPSRQRDALLAHELTHVVQQRQGADGPASSPASLEAEADGAARSFTRGRGEVAVHGRAPQGILHSDELPEVDDADLDVDDDEDDDALAGDRGRAPTTRSFAGLGADDVRPKNGPPSKSTPVVAPGPVPKPEAGKVPPRVPPSVDHPAPSPFMSPEDGFNYLISMRGSEASLPASYVERARQRAVELEQDGGVERSAAEVSAMRRERNRLRARLKRARVAAGTNKRDPQVVALGLEMHRLKADIAFRSKDAETLRNKLQHAPGGAGAETHGSRTYAVLELADANGVLLHQIPLSNRAVRADDPPDVHARIAAAKEKALKEGRAIDPGVHAEEAITIALERHIASLPPAEQQALRERIKGGSIHVTVDQEMCRGVCQPRLRDVAGRLGVVQVTATTVHAIKPDKHGAQDLHAGDLESAKATATAVTDEATVARRQIRPGELAAKTETVYSAKPGAQGQVAVRRLDPTSAPTLDLSDAPHPAPTNHSSAPQGHPDAASAQAAPHGAAPKPQAAHPSTTTHPSTAPVAGAKVAPPSSSAAVNRLNQADMALNAVKDYQRLKQEYLDAGDSEAVAQQKAVGRAGLTLAANLKGGKLGQAMNAVNAFQAATKAGQTKDEAAATTIGTVGGGLIANRVAPSGLAGTAVQLVNTAAQVVGAPQGVQDATSIAADLVPSSIVSTTITTGARSYHALAKAATGDLSSLDRLTKDMSAGDTGPWLQGYAQWTGIIADVASGDDFSKALEKESKAGEKSWAGRVGSKAGDAVFDLGQDEEILAGKYGPAVGGLAIGLNVTAGLARGESFSEAFAHTQKAAAAGQVAVRAKVRARIDAFRQSTDAAVSSVRQEAAATAQKAKSAIVSTVRDAETKVVQQVAGIRHEVDHAVDGMVHGADALAHKAADLAEHEIEAGDKFLQAKAAEAKNAARSGWNRLWGK